MAKLITYRERDDGRLQILFSDGIHWLNAADLDAAKATFPEPNVALRNVEPPDDVAGPTT